jgi:hypothetical protein
MPIVVVATTTSRTGATIMGRTESLQGRPTGDVSGWIAQQCPALVDVRAALDRLVERRLACAFSAREEALYEALCNRERTLGCLEEHDTASAR